MLDSLVTSYNHLAGGAVDLIMHGLSFLPPFGALAVVSAVAGAILVLLWGKVSNQEAIRRIKKRMHGAVLEAIVFRHDTGVSLHAQVKLFLLSCRYFLAAVPPLLILGIPCVLFMDD